MIHIEITNFQSIRHISFDIEGFTTIIGRNFLGKSAVLRAINAALTNASGTGFITWGETFCEVHIKNDKIDLLWHKEEGNNFYIIDNKKYDKIGRDDPPDEVFKAGLGTTAIGKDKINLLYIEQFFPLFLVDKKDSKGIDLLTAAYGLDKVYKAIDLCNKDQKSNKDLLRIRKKDLEVLTEDIKKYEGFEEVIEKKASIVSSRKNLSNKQLKIDKLKDLLRKISNVSVQVKILQDIRSVNIPESGPLDNIFMKLKKLKDLHDALIKNVSYINSLKPVESLTIPEGISFLEEKKTKLNIALELHKKFISLRSSVERLESITGIELPELFNISTNKIEKLHKLRNTVILLREEYKGLENKLNNLKEEEKTLLKDKEQFKGICPLCGK